MKNIKLISSIIALDPSLSFKSSSAILHLDNNGTQQDFIPNFTELSGTTEDQISQILNQIITIVAKAETSDEESFKQRVAELHDTFSRKFQKSEFKEEEVSVVAEINGEFVEEKRIFLTKRKDKV